MAAGIGAMATTGEEEARAQHTAAATSHTNAVVFQELSKRPFVRCAVHHCEVHLAVGFEQCVRVFDCFLT